MRKKQDIMWEQSTLWESVEKWVIKSIAVHEQSHLNDWVRSAFFAHASTFLIVQLSNSRTGCHWKNGVLSCVFIADLLKKI